MDYKIVRLNLDRAIANHDSTELNRIFEFLYNELWSQMYFIAFNHLKSKTDAEDIIHDVWLSFYEIIRTDGCYAVNNIRSYILSSVRNRSLNVQRNRLNVVDLDSGEIPDERQELYHQVLDLPESLRLDYDTIDIIEQHLLHDKSFQTIADEYSLSINTVKSRYRRGIAALKRTNGGHVDAEN